MEQSPANPPETEPPAPADESPPAEQPQGPRKLTAAEAARRYGVRALIILAVFGWFAYDGWLNPKYQTEEKRGDMWFNRVGAYILGAAFLYHGVMFGSAALTVRRQQHAEGEEPPDAPPSSPST